MKIANHQVQQSSERTFSSVSYLSQKLTVGTAAQQTNEQAAIPGQTDSVTLSEAAQKALDNAREQARQRLTQQREDLDATARTTLKTSQLPRDPMDLKLSILLRMIKTLTGKDFKLEPLDLGLGQDQGRRLPISFMGASQGGQRINREIRLEQTTAYHEYEAVSYQAQGVVNTADGKTIAFDVQLNMSREFMAYSQSSATMRQNLNVCDPLVINYGGTAASLTDTKFSFDLDVDGKMDRVSFAGPGSGFLALDKNGDGTINDGSELFGTQSGNGFADLRAYDRDGNNWIDENDEVYDQLRVWVKDEQGNDRLYSLKELDVGAIFLGEMETQFTVGNGSQVDGYVRSTSFFLRDSGGAGTIQHIDLVT